MTTCWIITEGMAGMENQCLGVAAALGVEPVTKRIQLREPWKTLTPWLGLEQGWSFTPKPEAPWPDLLLTCGRKSLAASRYIKKKSGGKTFTAHIQDPRASTRPYDLVAVPEHDPTRGTNVIVTLAAPNKITGAMLAEAKHHFAPLLQPLPAPRVAVLIGGNSKAYTMSPAIMRTLCAQLRDLDRQGRGLMITASRRTGVENQAILESEMKSTGAFLWDGQGENPLMGFLAWADYILVTADSVSMLSEAATTGKPVYMIGLDGGTARISAFHNSMIERGIIRPFEGKLDHWDYPALNDSGIIADAIRARMKI